MKEIPVSVGKTYAVTTAGSCTVTDADGRELCTAESGSQSYFTANGYAVTLSDDAATVTQVNFKQALAALRLLGGGDKLPAGYTRVEFLESTGTQYIDTGIFITGASGALCILEPVGATPNGWAITAGTYEPDRAFSIFVRRYDNVCFQYSNEVRYPLKDGTWVSSGNNVGELGYKLKEKCQVALNWLNDKQWVLEFNTDRIVYSELPNMLARSSRLYLFARFYNGKASDNETVRIYKLQLSQGEQQTNMFLPALDPTGTPCMFDLVSKQPFRNAGSGQFAAGVKDSAQLRAVLRKLPDRTGQDMGTLTLSIPYEANTPEMQELLDTTETQKNWELTIQERAAEVATYTLRRVRKVVWVRKVSAENGSYVDAEGSRWQTEWCSAIYSPRGNDPALHGYEPFDSVEQAAETWGLVPYVDPNAEDELLTEYENHGQDAN